MDWDREGRDWPNRESSRFVQAGGMRWHVQCMGEGPMLLLVHGTGAATHSWRDLAPLLAREFTVVAPDLPGHGFSAALPSGKPTLTAMAAAMRALLDTLEIEPEFALGHSAGAAIVARIALDGAPRLRGWIGLNGALLPLPGLPGVVFRPIARVLALNPLTSRVFAWRAADSAAVERLIASTGSHLDPAGVALYRRAVRDPDHVRGALAMMANWDLQQLERELPRMALPVLLIAASRDMTVPPLESVRAGTLMTNAELVELPGLGHLAHEEKPGETAEVVRGWVRRIDRRSQQRQG